MCLASAKFCIFSGVEVSTYQVRYFAQIFSLQGFILAALVLYVDTTQPSKNESSFVNKIKLDLNFSIVLKISLLIKIIVVELGMINEEMYPKIY